MAKEERDGDRRRWRVLAIASLSSFLVYLDVTVVNIAFPSIEAEFPEASREGLAWVLAAYNVAFAALLVPGGRIADRFGRRRVFYCGLIVFAAASAGCAAAPSAGTLIAARVLQAIGGAALVPASQGLVLAAFSIEERTKALSLWVAAGAVAAAIGPVLGGVLVDLADWRWVFVINLPIGAAALIAGRRVLTESRELHAGGLPDPIGVALAAGSVGLLTLGVAQGDAWGWGDPRVLGSLAAAALLAPLFVARSRGRLDAAIDLRLFRVRSFSLANAASLLIGVAFYGQLFAAVLFLTTVWGYDPLEAGLALAPSPAAAALAAGIAGRRTPPGSILAVAIAGIATFAAGAIWLRISLGAEPAYVAELLGPMLLLGAGGGVGVSMLTTRAAESLPADRFAVGSAVNSATRQVGAALGVATVVAVVGTPAPGEAVSAFGGVWLAIAAFAIASLATAAAISLAPQRSS